MVGQLVRHCFLEFVLLIEIDCHVLHLVQHEVSVRFVTGRFWVLGSVVLEGNDGGVVLLRDVHVVFGSSLISETFLVSLLAEQTSDIVLGENTVLHTSHILLAHLRSLALDGLLHLRIYPALDWSLSAHVLLRVHVVAVHLG